MDLSIISWMITVKADLARAWSPSAILTFASSSFGYLSPIAAPVRDSSSASSRLASTLGLGQIPCRWDSEIHRVYALGLQISELLQALSDNSVSHYSE